jgi:hypothetical protein
MSLTITNFTDCFKLISFHAMLLNEWSKTALRLLKSRVFNHFVLLWMLCGVVGNRRLGETWRKRSCYSLKYNLLIQLRNWVLSRKTEYLQPLPSRNWNKVPTEFESSWHSAFLVKHRDNFTFFTLILGNLKIMKLTYTESHKIIILNNYIKK